MLKLHLNKIRRGTVLVLLLALLGALALPAYADSASVPRVDTPNYKVSFYAFNCFNMIDDNGTRYGYGYEMMQQISGYLQATFSYVGYGNTAAECVEMLRRGELDIYTAAKKTPEREEEFAFSRHPAITAYTCMNVKVGNTAVVSGDYSTYNGLKIGLLQRHTYNNAFLEWAQDKGFRYEIVYYETPTELSRALVDGEVDALVNSYMGLPEDERTVENFGATPYYLMTRKEDQALIDAIDDAIDRMNVENPTWRSDLYNRYYGAQSQHTELTEGEQALLTRMQQAHTVIRAVLAPESAPYSYREKGTSTGITAEIFQATAERLGLQFEFIPAETKSAYLSALTSGEADVWLDADLENPTVGEVCYRTTEPYLKSSVSLLRERWASGGIEALVVLSRDSAVRQIVEENWPEAQVLIAQDTPQLLKFISSGQADGALLPTYTAQKLARDDLQNRFRTDIVQNTFVELRMGVNANLDRDFYGLWSKTLAVVAPEVQDGIIQKYTETMPTITLVQYLFDHPLIWIVIVVAALLILFLIVLYAISVKNQRKQKVISQELSKALQEANAATDAKNNFFSKMSHDIRTPLNVVLGMAQVAKKYKNDPVRLNRALDSIASEGNYLLLLVNSILDVNQLEYGHMELNETPFALYRNLVDTVNLVRPLAEKKSQHITVESNCPEAVVVGDSNRLSQIVMNIVSNAIKYTPTGGEIDIHLDALENGQYRFSCRDNGMGMTPEFLQHITENYVRAEDSRTSKVQGTGLGMSIVKGLTELMHGKLEVESAPEKGSTFTVTMPLQAATPEQAETLRQPEETGENPGFQGKKVLLAEDNALNAEIAAELLQSLGFTVDWADNGAIAVERLEASLPGTYYAVFMDMQMPVMDGVEATRRIRASRHPDRNIPIFAMTANTFDADKQRCKDAGMNGYISKPIDQSTIRKVLEETIS